MKMKLLVAILSALVMTSASAAVQCGPDNQRVVVKHDVIGAVSVDAFQHIDYASSQSLASALSEQTAHRLAAGTVACQIGRDGFHVGAAHLVVPGQKVDYWVPYRDVAAAE
ncbi:hypothetical protein [Paraburkholderia dinghuensis]|uniref:Uncharacterized protein n=1 Tax=Paraburkholderia dinghuensis TaxID=2305225 RepID=A0A3N6N4Q4_9BURK|nr:hypothetical protein [Paraburkholderia dinghuensis]RQH09595.1 hypothetical protein D1Y85_00030 [Paraburkholderia dinghuensis]